LTFQAGSKSGAHSQECEPGKPGSRAAGHPSNIAGDLVERQGERAQGPRELSQGIVLPARLTCWATHERKRGKLGDLSRGDVSKTRRLRELLPADGWQIKGERRVAGHGGCGVGLIAKGNRLDTDLLCESVTSRYSRRYFLQLMHNPS
jgi:hypothetical protein